MNTNTKRTRVYHFFLLLLCVSMTVFTTGCSNDSEDLLPTEATDDASLVAAQLKQLQHTRANDAYNVMIITTSAQITIYVAKNNPILVDWGDGNREYDVFTHTYTDNLPAHTIMLYSPDNNAITQLDLTQQSVIYLNTTKAPALNFIGCNSNRLTELNTTQNTALTMLTCSENYITALDITQNTQLFSLDCQHNQLTTLDASQNKNLTEIYCDYNQLSTLYTPAIMSTLGCSNNQLTTLDVSHNNTLFALTCNNNKLTTLDLSNKTKLSNFSCENNLLTSLNVSASTQLSMLLCHNNQIADIMIPQTSVLSRVECYNNPFEQDTYGQVLRLVGNLPGKQPTNKGSVTFSATMPQFDLIKQMCTGKNWDCIGQ